MSAIRRHPTATSYSVAYQRDLMAAKADVLLALRYNTLPIEQLVWQARTAYQRAWAAERERGGLAW
jgi:hypothetical protein